jgi:hypothetical protein
MRTVQQLDAVMRRISCAAAAETGCLCDDRRCLFLDLPVGIALGGWLVFEIAKRM